MIAICFGNEFFEQYFGQDIDAENMQTAFPVVEFHDMTENDRHHFLIAIFFVDLFGNHGKKRLLLRVCFDRAQDAMQNDFCVKRPQNIIGNTHFKGLGDIGIRSIFGDDDDRNILRPVLRFHFRQDAETIQHRHDHIQKDQRNACSVRMQELQGFLSVCGFENLKMRLQDLCQYFAVQRCVVNDQDFRFGLVLRSIQKILGCDELWSILCVKALFAVLGVVHQTICAFHSLFHRFVLADDTADTDGNAQLRIIRDPQFVEMLADMREFTG